MGAAPSNERDAPRMRSLICSSSAVGAGSGSPLMSAVHCRSRARVERGTVRLREKGRKAIMKPLPNDRGALPTRDRRGSEGRPGPLRDSDGAPAAARGRPGRPPSLAHRQGRGGAHRRNGARSFIAPRLRGQVPGAICRSIDLSYEFTCSANGSSIFRRIGRLQMVCRTPASAGFSTGATAGGVALNLSNRMERSGAGVEPTQRRVTPPHRF